MIEHLLARHRTDTTLRPNLLLVTGPQVRRRGEINPVTTWLEYGTTTWLEHGTTWVPMLCLKAG